MASLKQFLETGVLGPIRHGMTKEEVIAILGPPADESVERNPTILKYESLQLAFTKLSDKSRQTLSNIGLYFRINQNSFPEPTRTTDFEGSCDTTITEFSEFVMRSGIDLHSRIEGDESSYLIMGSGARITFDGQKLQSIQFAVRKNGPRKKQLTISVPNDTWDQLLTLAKNSNTSVAALCADWIAERATNH